jgi:hypothetical protein
VTEHCRPCPAERQDASPCPSNSIRITNQMLENTLYHKEAKRVKFEIEDFARGRCLHDDAQIILYVRLRTAGHAAFDSFVSAFPQLGGHPDDLAAAAAAFERSQVFSSAFAGAIEHGDRDALRAEWARAVHVARGRTSAARAAMEHAVAAQAEAASAAPDPARDIYEGMQRAEALRAEKREAAKRQMEENVNSYDGFNFVK